MAVCEKVAGRVSGFGHCAYGFRIDVEVVEILGSTP
jgi:hypothetical protein